MTPERKAQEGRNYQQLVADYRESKYDLVILGAHGLGQVERSSLGSVCERVVRLVECDVLVARNDRAFGSAPLLVAVDGSAHSFAALRRALGLARLYGMEVRAVAAFDPFFHSVAFKSISGVLSDEASKLFRFREQENLHDEIIDGGLMKAYHSHLLEAQRIASADGVALEVQVLEGKPFDAIVSYVEHLRPALLLVGRVGMHRTEGLTLGSTAENLLRAVDCNVLVVNHQAEETVSATPRGASSTERPPAAHKASNVSPSLGGKPPKEEGGVGARPRWTVEAEKRLGRVPFFARTMARRGIERFAQENGQEEITPKVYEQARSRFGM